MIELIITHTARNVNSKSIQREFVDLVNTTAADFIIRQRIFGEKIPRYSHDFSQLIEFLLAQCEDMVDQKLITTHDVIGDHRNNDVIAMDNGVVTILVKYQQFNCLNITQIEFKIEVRD